MRKYATDEIEVGMYFESSVECLTKRNIVQGFIDDFKDSLMVVVGIGDMVKLVRADGVAVRCSNPHWYYSIDIDNNCNNNNECCRFYKVVQQDTYLSRMQLIMMDINAQNIL